MTALFRSPAARALRSDTGAVTAELAVVMPAVTAVLAVVLGTGQAVLAKVTCVDAARAGARAAARGEGLDQVRQLAMVAADGPGAAGEGLARVDVETLGEQVAVTVTRSMRLVALGPTITMSARALAQREGAVGR